MNALPSKAPSEIVYLPEGEHDITPTVDGKAKRIVVSVPPEEGEAIAASLQVSLEERQRQNVRPWLDFDHKGGVAAGLPKRFRYQPGQGIILSVDWTGAGKAAIEGRDFSYFSPAFLIGKDGRPARVTPGGSIGSLVNEPAFRELPRIAAAHAGPDITEPDSDPATAAHVAKIEAALSSARRILGEDAPFIQIWGRAADIAPDTFNA